MIKEILNNLSKVDHDVLWDAFEAEDKNTFVIYKPGHWIGVNMLPMKRLTVTLTEGHWSIGTL